jgi:hypothetical protein
MTPNDPSLRRRAYRALRWFPLLTVLSIAGLILLVKSSYLLGGEPYTMTITPFQGPGQVQFFEPSEHYVSPVFEVDYPFQSSHVVQLDSEETVVPGGTIEFCDTAPMPGCFKIRIGQTKFEIMEAWIRVDGRDYDWAAQ